MATFAFFDALRESLKPRRFLIWLLLCVGCFGLGLQWEAIIGGTADERYGQLSSMIVFRMLALAAAILSTNIISQEIEQKTVVYLLTRPIPRWQLLLARLGASVIVTFIIGLLGALGLALGVYHTLPLGEALFLRDIPALGFASLAYCSLFLLISLMFNRAMLVCLIYAFGVEMIAPSLQGDLYKISLFSYAQGIAQHPVMKGAGEKGLTLISGQLADHPMETATAIISLVVVSLACSALSVWWFGHFEYVPREDAE
ncbi:MAG: ABC transporter permease subunit [Armatimonadetes bacterium]|nr:ABC transporter permease subunit [Armatimonadota bacterium]